MGREVTVSYTTADSSYLEALSREAGTAAELAASKKVIKYAGLLSQGEFVPIAVESHGPINKDALQFLSEFGRRLVETTGMFEHLRRFRNDLYCVGWGVKLYSRAHVFIPTDFHRGATF